MGTSVVWDDPVSVKCFLHHDNELWCRDDLSDGADIIQADVQRAECGRNAAQRGVIFIAQLLGRFRNGRLIETCERRRGWCSSASTRPAPSPATAIPADIGAAPPHTGQIRMAIRQ